MPRRSILSTNERDSLFALPDAKDELIRHYAFNETDLAIIRQHRGQANRLGFAVQLCYLRFPGIVLGVDEPPFPPLLRQVAAQLKVPVESWGEYGQREQTRREHLVELKKVFGFKPFTMSHYRQAVHTLTELALQTDKGIVLASALVENLRRQTIIMPAMNALERASVEAINRANRCIYAALTDSLWQSIVNAWTNCSSARTAARRHGWPGCASHRPSRIHGTCSNISSALKLGKHSTYLLASSGWFIRIGYSRSPAKGAK